MATSANSPLQDLLPMELPLTRSAEGSRARTSQTLASALALRVSEAVSGPNTRASLANYDPMSFSWRTSQRCLVEGWTVFSETWPRSGMMRGGIAYQLQPLAPLTEGTDSGWSLGMVQKPSHSVPTPTTSDHIERRCTSTEMLNPDTNKSMSLDRYVKFWPTPNVIGFRSDGELRLLALAASSEAEFVGMSHKAARSKRARYWPTASANDYKGSSKPGQRRGQLTDPAMGVIPAGGQLNPTWVEWLMGFPTGHTDLRPSETP